MRTASAFVRGAGILAAVAAVLAALDLAETGDGRAFMASQIALLPASVALGVAPRHRPVTGAAVALLGIAAGLLGATLGDAGPTAPAWLLLETAWAVLVAVAWNAARPGLAVLAVVVAAAAGLGLIRAMAPVAPPLGSLVGVRAALTVAWLAWMATELALWPRRAGG